MLISSKIVPRLQYNFRICKTEIPFHHLPSQKKKRYQLLPLVLVLSDLSTCYCHSIPSNTGLEVQVSFHIGTLSRMETQFMRKFTFSLVAELLQKSPKAASRKLNPDAPKSHKTHFNLMEQQMDTKMIHNQLSLLIFSNLIH